MISDDRLNDIIRWIDSIGDFPAINNLVLKDLATELLQRRDVLRWIPVESGLLPRLGKCVQVMDENRGRAFAFRNPDGRWIIHAVYPSQFNIVYWQELSPDPLPPEEVTNA